MSHSVKVILIADQEIELLGEEVNIHDLKTIYLDSRGKIIEYALFPPNKAIEPTARGLFIEIS